MSEIHRSRSLPGSVLKFLAELGMITVAVFLGLLADQWRESRQHREQARAILENFRAEMQSNRRLIESVKEYHATLRRDLESIQVGPGPGAATPTARFSGVRPVHFEHTAWDLGVATQSLTYLDAKLAYAISQIYTHQQAFETYENAFAQSMLAPSSFVTDNRPAVVAALVTYLNDVVAQEPAIVLQYDTVVPQIDAALGVRTAAAVK